MTNLIDTNDEFTSYDSMGWLNNCNGPAVIQENGNVRWHIHGEDVTTKVKEWIVAENITPNWREWTDNDRAAYQNKFLEKMSYQRRNNGDEFWFDLAGKPHRIDGPARMYKGIQDEWWQHGVVMRLEGPAIINQSGLEHWYVNGQNVTRTVEQWISDNGVNPNWKEWTLEEKTLFRLRF